AWRDVRAGPSRAVAPGRSFGPRLPGDQRGNRRELFSDARQHVATLSPDAAQPERRESVSVAPDLRQSRQPAACARGGARTRAGGARGAWRTEESAGAADDHA